MNRTLYRLIASVLLAAFAAGCSEHNEKTPAPTPRAVASDFSYTFYTTPEPVVFATCDSRPGPGAPPERPYILGASVIPGGHPIYYFTDYPRNYDPNSSVSGTWTPVSGPNSGGAVKLITARERVTGSGTEYFYLYAITAQNELWVITYGPSPAAPVWRNTGQLATDVAVSNSPYGPPTICFLGVDNIQGGHPIYQLTSSGTSFGRMQIFAPAAGVGLTIDYYNRPWVVTDNQQIWVGPALGTSGGFAMVAGAGVGIASNGPTIAVLGTTYDNTGYEVYKRNASDPITSYTWTHQGGALTQIAAQAGGGYGYVGVSSNGQLWVGR